MLKSRCFPLVVAFVIALFTNMQIQAAVYNIGDPLEHFITAKDVRSVVEPGVSMGNVAHPRALKNMVVLNALGGAMFGILPGILLSSCFKNTKVKVISAIVSGVVFSPALAVVGIGMGIVKYPTAIAVKAFSDLTSDRYR